MAIDQGLAATLAAGIAAVASVATLLLNLRASSRSAMRAAHRDAIRDHLENLSENIHTVVAGVVVIRKRTEQGSEVPTWQEKGKTAGSEIGGIRRRTTYLLPRLGPAMRQLELASVVGDDDGGEAVGLMLPGLPRDCRLFEAGQIPGDASGAGLQALQQRRRARHRVPAPPREAKW